MNEESLFAAALNKAAGAERQAFLEAACGSDIPLRQRVEQLLAADRHSSGILEHGPVGPGATVHHQPIVERPGTIIGPYKLLQQIGEGGMGAVFMAEQTQPVRRKVALKIIKPGMDSAQVIARFEAERQALAMMEHQNIARVLDAGTTDGGRPYFVMELVHGVPITQFCDDRKLTPQQRLELFVPVCQAIQHAHQKGIIHRDIKPSNVLVTMYDDKPVPKVIDFGVAKAIEQRLTERTMFTQFGALVGTFEYMSPEQAELNAFGVDTRSDVYSLGVLLYELVTGTTPLEKERLRQAALAEVVRLIKEEEPPRPSLRLSSSHNLPKIAAARNTEPARLSELVRGEVDWIVMKCLEKDRTRRYESASGLAHDVQRHLADEPVEACPPSAGYRLRKFARKYRTPLRVAGAFLLMLVLGVVVSTWQAIRATVAERVAWESERAAQEQKREADEAKEQAEMRSDQLTKLNDTLLRANYISDMNLARVAWDESNLDRGRELLNKYRPHAGEKDQRGFEWHYLNRLLHGHEMLIKAHGGLVTAVAFTPDGKRLISSGTSQPPQGMQYFQDVKRDVKQWDAATGQPLPFPHKGQIEMAETLTALGDRVERFVLNRDGTLMAASCRDHAIRVWDIATGGLFTLEGPARHTASGIDFSPDGKRLVSVHRPDDASWSLSVSSLKIWDLATRKAVVTLDHFRAVDRLFFSPDGKLLAAVLTNLNVVRVWDAATGNVAYECKYVGGLIRNAVFNPEGNRLAACGENGVRIWDTATHQPVASFRSDSNYGLSVVFSPGGTRLAIGGIEGVVEVWDIQSCQKIHTYKGHSGNVRRLVFSPDGKRLATGGSDGTLRVWDLTGRWEIVSIPKPDGALEFPFLSPDGQTVCTGVVPNSGRGIQLWDTTTGEPRGGLIRLAKPAFSPAWTADGRRLYLADEGNTITVVATESAKVLRTFQVDSGGEYLRFFALSSDESWCAHNAGPEAKTIKVRNVRTGAELRTLKGLDERVHYLLFSPDGSRLLAADAGGTLKLWEMATGREVAATKLSGIYITSIAFSPDGKHVAVAGGLMSGEARILDAEDFREVWSLRGHTLTLQDAVFSPDGKRLATASMDRMIRIWDLTAGKEILKLSGLEPMTNLRFDSDGRRLRSVSTNRTIRFWDATPLPD